MTINYIITVSYNYMLIQIRNETNEPESVVGKMLVKIAANPDRDEEEEVIKDCAAVALEGRYDEVEVRAQLLT